MNFILAPMITAFMSLSCASSEIWKMGEQFYEMDRNDLTRILISKSCIKKSCEASKILKTISFKKIAPEKFIGGKNPGAVLCHELKNAQVIFMRDLNDNDNSFCLFQDKSLVSSGSLDISARKNDEK